jgi:hypothetical protein
MPEQFAQEEAERRARAAIPDRMSNADMHMLDSGKQPVPADRSGDMAYHRDEHEFKLIENRCFEDSSVHPRPDNDVVVGVALVIWSTTLGAVFEHAGHSTFPIAHTGAMLEKMLDALPKQSSLELVIETAEVKNALGRCCDHHSDGSGSERAHWHPAMANVHGNVEESAVIWDSERVRRGWVGCRLPQDEGTIVLGGR